MFGSEIQSRADWRNYLERIFDNELNIDCTNSLPGTGNGGMVKINFFATCKISLSQQAHSFSPVVVQEPHEVSDFENYVIDILSSLNSKGSHITVCDRF